ncbi:LLM class flavin-dependent oxidoreductase [Variovorax sp. GB1R11]|uniref:LLM class flavin-dependent oxidoreductase n=1 Tax=Variovorax sp. GB1R11 TaxID=3443741 RepID=UPI003F44A1E4
MSYSLSLLDKSLIPEGADAAQAFQHTIALAQSAERLGYRRYWLAEHHGNKTYAGSAPEVLAAHVLAKTSRIRVGTGGVMLQHYSPFKVAETFRVLAALAPGRVDLGIGKAPGGLPLTSKALQWLHDPEKKSSEDFGLRLAELDAFLHDGVAPGHALAGAVATPNPPQLPQRVLLGGSPESAVLAARLGWQFVYAGHFNGDPVNLAQSVEAYRAETGRAPWLALFAFAAHTSEEAAERVGALRSFRVYLPTGQTVNLPSLDAAAEFARQAGVSDYRTEERRPHVIAGTGEEVRDALDALSARHGIEEFVIDIPVADFAARHASVELLATARDRVPA